jgi:exosome complex exonuclease DIS3/RRP44
MLDRIFTKKTRRGNILKIVREHYLRDDLSCGSANCKSTICSSSTLQEKQKNILDSHPQSKSNLIKEPHYLVPDTNIILHQVILLF